MKLNLTVTMDNAAFDPSPNLEAGRILSDLARLVARRGDLLEVGDGANLRDINGNRVGEWKVTND